jgi:hypothetical protein
MRGGRQKNQLIIKQLAWVLKVEHHAQSGAWRDRTMGTDQAENSAIDSTCAVCGNMLATPAPRKR